MTLHRMVELLEIEMECVRRNGCGECNRACHVCDLLQDDTELHEMYAEVIARMKAQEPRLLTWDEFIAADHFYIETNKDRQKYIVPGIVTIVRDTAAIVSVRIGTRLIDGTIDKDVYGIECRCWTSRPTDEQREATAWDC